MFVDGAPITAPLTTVVVQPSPHIGKPEQRFGADEPHRGRRGEQVRDTLVGARLGHIDWVIVGGESGPHSRPFDLTWARSIRDQCKAAGVACFIKQLGADPRIDGAQFPAERRMGGWDHKGGDPEFWPEDLRVRCFPK